MKLTGRGESCFRGWIMDTIDSLTGCCFHNPLAASTNEKSTVPCSCHPSAQWALSLLYGPTFLREPGDSNISSQKGCQRREKLSGSIILMSVQTPGLWASRTLFITNTLTSEELNRSAQALQRSPNGQTQKLYMLGGSHWPREGFILQDGVIMATFWYQSTDGGVPDPPCHLASAQKRRSS